VINAGDELKCQDGVYPELLSWPEKTFVVLAEADLADSDEESERARLQCQVRRIVDRTFP
jgi:hypothetical protein